MRLGTWRHICMHQYSCEHQLRRKVNKCSRMHANNNNNNNNLFEFLKRKKRFYNEIYSYMISIFNHILKWGNTKISISLLKFS